MIIVCSGPDTYRAREKARELVVAFRTKHDQSGLATEIVDGSQGIAPLLSRLAGASLFAPKKLIRADGCLAKMKIADVRTLATRLEQDKDQAIILTVEDEPPTAKTLETLKMAPLFHYPFPLQTGSMFRTWTREQAASRSLSQKIADAIAEYAEGDSWLAIQELEKQAAHAQDIEVHSRESGTVFEVADAILFERQGWRSDVAVFEDDGAVSVALGQARSYLRIRDGFTDGLHPYVVKKLGALRMKDEPKRRFLSLLRAFVASRTGLANDSEAEGLI